ncbi:MULTISPECIES: glycosyltransferase family 4 protein [Gammaproteobacteria]|uniref:glycosyltransferase family 4 protein n=1 Tax=Gammaproteobacteria TaxID=1236 RepID=UPI003A95B25C
MHSLNPPTIHQFAIDCTPGDGITNGMLLTRKLLRLAGVRSDIYCAGIAEALMGDVLPMQDYQPGGADALLVHHGIGNSHEGWLRQLPERKIMVFHNITPSQLFPTEHPIQPMLSHGWQQVDSWKEWLTGSIADSRQNLDELLQRGYDPVRTVEIPLLVDLERLAPGAVEAFDSPRPFTLLFVGRVMPHKNQLALVDTFAEVLRRVRVPLQLYIVGGFTIPEYAEQIQRRIDELGLGGFVTLTGKVDDATLIDLYRRSDLFVSMSRHEGFGMPLIEAMVHGLPVMAYNAEHSNVAHTLDGAGLLLDSCDPQASAAAIVQLMNNPALRGYLRRRGTARLADFNYQKLYDRLRDHLEQFHLHLPAHAFPDQLLTSAGVDYRIEGPFDSSYSLALVNRELARALTDQGRQVALRATEGPGPMAADANFLVTNADCAAMHARQRLVPKNVLRLLYPPRVTDMQGETNVLSCYGWEESCLPESYCHDFNHQLHLVTSMSSWVTRTLRDNGVTAPLATVGLGADHIVRVEPDASLLPALPQVSSARLRLLHISSCFPRKGIDVLLRAYASAFTAKDAVVLIIKTFPNPHHDIAQELANWRAANPEAPAVELINADLSDAAIRALYQLADVLVAPSRGEGFGLPMAEAMLHRCPVITTGQGGQRDFCTPQTSWLIDYRYARARTHLQAGPSVWFEPDAEHLARLLTEFYGAWKDGRLQDMTAARIEAAETLIREQFCWGRVAAATEQAIAAAAAQSLLKPAPRLGCVSSWNSACGIATYSRKLIEPAFGSECHVFANDDAQRFGADEAHVERCWTAGDRDDLQRLRTAIERSGVDVLLLQFNFSFFSLSAFAELLDWAHGRGIRTLVTFHSTADVQHGKVLKSLRDLRGSLAGCERLLVHSVADLNRLLDFGLPDNLLLFPHGVIDTQPPAPGLEQQAAGLAGKTVIASYGFLLPHKGVPELIEAFALLAKADPSLHLLLVNAEYPVPASAELLASCRARIQNADLAGRVTLVSDYLQDAESLAWLGLADCIVFPYQHTQESSSAAVRWGLSTGRPVLCTPLDIFEDVAEAVTFLPGTSSKALADGLSRCLGNLPQGRQDQWLRTHAWSAVSARLRNLTVALRQ